MRLGRCAIRGDDFEKVMERFLRADLFVLGAPVYWLSPPGVMKNFIARTHGYYLDRSILRGKRAAIISVTTEGGFEPHEEVMTSWLRVYGAEVLAKARILACEKGEVLKRPGELRKVDLFVDEIVRKVSGE